MKAELFKNAESNKKSILDKMNKTTLHHDQPEGQIFEKETKAAPMFMGRTEDENITKGYNSSLEYYRKKVRKGKRSWMNEFADKLEGRGSFMDALTYLKETLTKDEINSLDRISKSIEALKKIKK